MSYILSLEDTSPTWLSKSIALQVKRITCMLTFHSELADFPQELLTPNSHSDPTLPPHLCSWHRQKFQVFWNSFFLVCVCAHKVGLLAISICSNGTLLYMTDSTPQEWVSLYNPGYPRTHYIYQAASASQVKGLQACTSTV